MWTYYPELLTRPVPRYTSYPTAAEFSPDANWRDQKEALAKIPEGGEISLYIHIPYCRQICWYCGCNTGRANRPQLLDDYLDALACEIKTVSRRLGRRYRISRISFGGGSPNAMSALQFVRLLENLMLSLSPGEPDISIELDPRDFDETWARTLGRCRVSHASLGVQSFDNAIQHNIGRVQPEAMIRDAVTHLRANNVRSINMDLMYGLPGQTINTLDETLDRAIALKPDRIALFGYAHIPHLLQRQRRIDASALPDQATRFAMAAHGFGRLVEAGYMPVGFDHFALPDDPLAHAMVEGRIRRNFQGFTDDDCKTLIGFGASAISTLPGLIIQNEKVSGRYRALASASMLCGTRGVRVCAQDESCAALIEALLCGRKADLEDYPRLFEIERSLVPFVERGLASFDGRWLSVTSQGLPYARTIAALFDRFRAVQPERFSSAV